jgi:NTP pyrophosphatase (non-canonical NTP hydrolase)
MKITDLDVRTEVARFALAMEAKLRANDHKRPWRYCPLQYLSMRLTQERRELVDAIAARKDVIGECADVANFAMMIADKVGELPALPGAPIAKCGLETEASD